MKTYTLKNQNYDVYTASNNPYLDILDEMNINYRDRITCYDELDPGQPKIQLSSYFGSLTVLFYESIIPVINAYHAVKIKDLENRFGKHNRKIQAVQFAKEFVDDNKWLLGFNTIFADLDEFLLEQIAGIAFIFTNPDAKMSNAELKAFFLCQYISPDDQHEKDESAFYRSQELTPTNTEEDHDEPSLSDEVGELTADMPSRLALSSSDIFGDENAPEITAYEDLTKYADDDEQPNTQLSDLTILSKKVVEGPQPALGGLIDRTEQIEEWTVRRDDGKIVKTRVVRWL